jgi:hypothetical protein
MEERIVPYRVNRRDNEDCVWKPWLVEVELPPRPESFGEFVSQANSISAS